MSKAIEVVIREPNIGWGDILVRFIVGLFVIFLAALFVMILTPFVFGIELDYWQAVAFMALAQLVWPRSVFPHLRASEKQKGNN